MSCSTLQLVDAEGDFDGHQVARFLEEAHIDSAGQSYTVVAIMGPQSSGKSTLLNHVFGTSFEEMDALEGRTQTTRGIWLASSPKVPSPPTVVMDLEGSDGRERGEDDTSFEKQSALFALATADVLLVNMWAKDVGREFGSGKPLLKTIFQVNLKLFRPSPGARRTVLLFVFRDRTRTPLEKLKETWEGDLGRMWAAITKPPEYESCAIEEFFDIQYAALSNYEDRPEDFQAEATLLRRNFSEDAAEGEGFLRPPGEKLPGAALALSMGKVWEIIRANKDLNLPAHRVMVANIRCKEIAQERLDALKRSEEWSQLEAEAQQDIVPGFGTRVEKLIAEAMASYDAEARYFDSSVSTERHVALLEEIQSLIYPTFQRQIALAAALAFEQFQEGMNMWSEGRDASSTFVEASSGKAAAAMSEFDTSAEDILVPNAPWTADEAREKLARDITAHQTHLRSQRISKALKAAQTSAQDAVSNGAMPLLEAPPEDLWSRLEAVVGRESSLATAQLLEDTKGLGLTVEEEAQLRGDVEIAAKKRLLANAKEAANTVLPRMKDAFTENFQKDEAGMPRTWTPSLDISKAAVEARSSAARLLAQLCIMRLAGAGMDSDQTSSVEELDEKTLSIIDTAIVNLGHDGGRSSGSASRKLLGGGPKEDQMSSFDLLSAADWPGIPKQLVLLSPSQVRTAWKQFVSDSALVVQQAKATQEANRLAQNRLPPVWALIAILVLGFDEAVAVIRNPLLLVLVVIFLSFAKTVYEKLEVEREMQRGLLPGSLAIWAKLGPTLRAVVVDVLRSMGIPLQEPERAPQYQRFDSVSSSSGRDDWQTAQEVTNSLGLNGLARGSSGDVPRSRHRWEVEMTEGLANRRYAQISQEDAYDIKKDN